MQIRETPLVFRGGACQLDTSRLCRCDLQGLDNETEKSAILVWEVSWPVVYAVTHILPMYYNKYRHMCFHLTSHGSFTELVKTKHLSTCAVCCVAPLSIF